MRRASLLLTILLSTTLFACSSSKSGSANPGDGMETGDGNIPVAKPGSELSDVQFDFDSSALSAEAQQTLRNNGKYLVDTNKGVQIEGHCDERGTNEYNLALGERRARAAYDFLHTIGVNKDQMSTISYGEEIPLDAGHTEAAWSKNRRGHFAVK